MPMIKGVYDYVPEKTLLPYVTFSRVYSEPFETKTSTGEIVTLTLTYSLKQSGKERVHPYPETNRSILTPELEVEGAFLMDQSVVSREVQEIAKSLYQATIEYKIKLDWSE
ncbi:hypothetical protein P7H17_00030 [Paenibacillus larvae]|nr:hypothetical protein [Paenibacillus larvae]MDT2284832.1 hypothetical protein [Paenibacillus larvae]